jgi:hypothetical protein
MGWKNVKEHYKISHLVRVSEEGLCIGSAYIPEIIVIAPDGRLQVRHETSNEDLMRYQAEMEADRETLLRLMQSPDTFSASIPVYTYRGSEIIEKFCEEPGWPNTTHDGCMMHDNRYSMDKSIVVGWAKASAASAIEYTQETIAEAELKLEHQRNRLAEHEANLTKLNAAYPDIQASN